MPRKNALPKEHQDLAARIGRLRKHWRLSRSELAHRTGASEGVITRVELGRTPLPYSCARLILAFTPGGIWSQLAPINPLWLAYGDGPEQLDWPLFLPENKDIGLHYDTPFLSFVESHRLFLEGLVRDVPEADLPEHWLLPYFTQWRRMLSWERKVESGNTFLECVFLYSAQKLKDRSRVARRLLRLHEKAEAAGMTKKHLLTRESINRKPQDVQSALLKNLLQRVQRLTTAKGAKSSLAKAIDVPQSRLSEWLAGKHEPSGEIALRLDKWVRERGRET